MSKTLNLIDHLLRRARNCHDLGFDDEARASFERLASFRQLPAPVAEEVQVRLAEVCRQRDDRFHERQHLAGALAHHPRNPEHNFRMAEACRDDGDVSAEIALGHFREAVRLAPSNARYLAGLADMLCRLGEFTESLRWWKSAYERDEDSLAVLEGYAQALIDADRAEDARRLLRDAMFRHSNDRRFRDLERDFRFRAVARTQSDRNDEPVILPMIRTSQPRRRFAIDGQIFRIDAAEKPAGPVRRKVSRKRRPR